MTGWRYDGKTGTISDGDYPVAYVSGRMQSRDDPDALATGNLLAAAPELYEALKWAVDTLRARSPEVLGSDLMGSLAASALVKAEGTT